MGILQWWSQSFSHLSVQELVRPIVSIPKLVNSGSLQVTAGSLLYWVLRCSSITPPCQALSGRRNFHEGHAHFKEHFLPEKRPFPWSIHCTSFACFGYPGRRIEKFAKWPFGRPPALRARGNGHFCAILFYASEGGGEKKLHQQPQKKEIEILFCGCWCNFFRRPLASARVTKACESSEGASCQYTS